MQARTACLSTMTVHAPQSAWPQPNLVPVRPDLIAEKPEQRKIGIAIPVLFLAINLHLDHDRLSLFIQSRHERLFEVSENIYPGTPPRTVSGKADLAEKLQTAP